MSSWCSAKLRKAGLNFTPDVVNDQASFLHSLDASAPDLLLADYSLPGFHGLAALAFARQRLPHLPVVIVSGAIGEETAIEALKAGATDYVLKQRLSRLGTVIERALREERQRRDQECAEQELRGRRNGCALPFAVSGTRCWLPTTKAASRFSIRWANG